MAVQDFSTTGRRRSRSSGIRDQMANVGATGTAALSPNFGNFNTALRNFDSFGSMQGINSRLLDKGGTASGIAGGAASGADGYSFADTQFGLGEAGARRRFSQQNLGLQARLEELGRSGERAFRDISQAYRQAAPQQITSFTGRGLGRSGLFQQAMQQFAGAQQQDLADLAQSQAAEQAQIELERQNAAVALQDELDRLELQRQQQILADAAALSEFAPIAGLV